MRAFTVAGGLIENDNRWLLVRNRRRDGSEDWTTPGGVIDPGEAVVEGLTREVEEETGLWVAHWDGPVWHVEVDAPGMGWTLAVEVYRAASHAGEVRVDDPDGIVVEAAWQDAAGCSDCLATAWRPVHEPMQAWLAEPWVEPRHYRYRLDGTDRRSAQVVRLG